MSNFLNRNGTKSPDPRALAYEEGAERLRC